MNKNHENGKSVKTKKKRTSILISIILAVSIVVAAVCFTSCDSESGLGSVTQISVNKKSDDTMELSIKYTPPAGGYSVRVVPEDEGEYVGDGMTNYDGSLGKYRILIEFGDVEPSSALALQLSINETIQSSPAKLKARIAHPSDHGFVLYIGSDTPISVETVEGGELNPLGGTIKIPITIENE